jgi:hypothetical protein
MEYVIFTVNFDLKTKKPSTVINKKILKKKKKKLKEKGVAAATPEVAGWLAAHPGLRGDHKPPQRWPEPPLRVARKPPGHLRGWRPFPSVSFSFLFFFCLR